MTKDRPVDPVEQEIRQALAQEAAEPAPERLVARVAAIPREAGPSSVTARLRDRLRGGLGGPARAMVGVAAAGLVLVVAGTVLLGGLGSGPASGPAASARVIASLPTVMPTVSPPPGGPIPVGFQPVSVTFASASDGWLLGTATCAGSPCAAIARTEDGGRTWASIPAPDASITPGGLGTGSSGVSALRMADALDGWAFGPDLWATHDGGATWHRVTLPGAGADAQVMSLEAAAGAVHAAFFDGAGAVVRIATSPVGEDAWTVSPTTVPVGAGPVPHAQLVLQGEAGWLVEVDRVVVGGAHLAAGAWEPWQPPCLDVAGPATLAASSDVDLVAACDVGLWSTPEGVHAYASTDAGASFTETTSRPPVFSIDGVAAPSASSIVVGGSLAGVGSALVSSFDGGKSWSAAYTLAGAGSFYDLGFTTADQGVVITRAGDFTASGMGGGNLLMTRDGGRTWAKVTIAAQ